MGPRGPGGRPLHGNDRGYSGSRGDGGYGGGGSGSRSGGRRTNYRVIVTGLPTSGIGFMDASAYGVHLLKFDQNFLFQKCYPEDTIP